jgi:hypothetical protein
MPFPTIWRHKIFKISPLCAYHGAGVSWESGPLSLSSWLHERPSCGIYINISCMYFTEGSVYLQHNVMLYIQKSVSENAGIVVIGVEKYKIFWGRIPPDPPTIKCDTTPNFLLPTTIYHFSTLGIVWSLFVVGPPTDEFLKNALALGLQFWRFLKQICKQIGCKLTVYFTKMVIISHK